MATIALPRPIAPHRSSGIDAAINLDALGGTATSPVPPAVPNKHLPECPSGSPSLDEPSSPPASPSTSERGEYLTTASLLYPTDKYIRMDDGSPSPFKISADGVAAALDFGSRQPLPEPSAVFPWLHGLHPHNQIQQAFFGSRRRGLRRPPACLRGTVVVKADGDLSFSRLKGAITVQEFMDPDGAVDFLDPDPREGFSVRNFQIQPAKVATTSDIIVYGDDDVLVRELAWSVFAAQGRWRERHISAGHPIPMYNTFVCTSKFSEFEENHPSIVAVDSTGRATGRVVDFPAQERREMHSMTKASEISHNVWLGPTPESASHEDSDYDILVECSDLGRLRPESLKEIAENPDQVITHTYLDFPSSGSILPPTWSQQEADGILETCKWIYHLSHGTYPDQHVEHGQDGHADLSQSFEVNMPAAVPRRILIHCADGYTESTMLGIAYFAYSTGRPVADAWLSLHTTMRRNFFAYATDVALLTAISPRLLAESPEFPDKSIANLTRTLRDIPKWLPGLDGSFPSRILDYMYLGNLGHANNPDLLKALGIKQILSVGETAMWRDGELEEWGESNVCVIQGVQDNGIDPLTGEFKRCLDFIERGRKAGVATLVHCRVGVSRSATICIAEVMREMKLSFPRAYCFVRARRLNVIIQPHLRFAYELLKWEEVLAGAVEEGELGRKRELEWCNIAREVALMNKPYSR